MDGRSDSSSDSDGVGSDDTLPAFLTRQGIKRGRTLALVFVSRISSRRKFVVQNGSGVTDETIEMHNPLFVYHNVLYVQQNKVLFIHSFKIAH